MNPYIGHETQISGVEEHRLVGGKGDGMRLYAATNGKGLELTLSPDRNGDITRLRYKGINMSYFSPCGYVAPAYYDKTGSNWLQSFTAGFLTTCGLQAVGTPCTDDGEELPLHGSIANQPCAHSYWDENEKEICIHSVTKDEVIFGRKLVLTRTVKISKEEKLEWKHSQKDQKEEEENITVAKQEILNHYAFMEELLTYGESKGKKYFSFVESYIPALSSRRCRE